MAATKRPKYKPGSIDEAFATSGRYRRLDERAAKWGIPGASRCPTNPRKGEWQRLDWKAPGLTKYDGEVPFSELAMYTGQAGAKIFRVAIHPGGRYAEVCTSKGYVDGLVGEVIGHAQACRMGVKGIDCSEYTRR